MCYFLISKGNVPLKLCRTRYQLLHNLHFFLKKSPAPLRRKGGCCKVRGG